MRARARGCMSLRRRRAVTTVRVADDVGEGEDVPARAGAPYTFLLRPGLERPGRRPGEAAVARCTTLWALGPPSTCSAGTQLRTPRPRA
eukprot:scaffold474_cov365-Prasinococcus_capsulatus_cf.AAC.5